MPSEKAIGSSSGKVKQLKGGQRKPKPYASVSKQDAADLPGVQKIKSAIRQTRRLLAKVSDNSFRVGMYVSDNVRII